MTPDTDSHSSSQFPISEHEKKRKKLKRKSEKKYKKEKNKRSHKEKKRFRREKEKITSREIEIDTHIKKTVVEVKCEENDCADAFGPALPPHILKRKKEAEKSDQLVIGPVLPKELLRDLGNPESRELPEKLSTKYSNVDKSESEEENLKSSYGPLPITTELKMTPAQLELEQRALELKLAAIDGTNASTSNQKVREEWMLELPDVGLKSGLAALNNLKRGFHQGKEKPDFSDRSSWTKTPNCGQEKSKAPNSKEEVKVRAQELYIKQRDAEQESIAKKHKKKHKRDESLVEIHQKKLHKEEKRKAKELEKSGGKPERRPFSRDVDLKLNKIDRNQTKSIVDKAKILHTKFSSGHSKYL